MDPAERTELVESTADFADRTLEAIALLVGKVGGRYVMPCGIIATPAVVEEMNKVLNPTEVRVYHRVGMVVGTSEVRDLLLFETTNEKQRTLLAGVRLP